jgi:hypothetical protein
LILFLNPMLYGFLQIHDPAWESVCHPGFPVVMEKFWALRNYAWLYKHLETV